MRAPRKLTSILLALVVLGAVAGAWAQSAPDVHADQFESAQLDVEVSSTAGAPLAGVSVASGSGAAALTDAQGKASLAVGAGATQVVRFSRAGYTDQFKPLYFEGRLRRAFLRAQMMPRAPEQVIPNIQAGATVNGPDGAVLVLPPNALVGPGGVPVTGTVTIQMTPVDVAGPELGAFPGAFAGREAGGAQAAIESFGTVEYLITQGGQALQLANGVTATLDLPIYPGLNQDGQPIAAGQTLPLWFLDEASGYWREEGLGTVVVAPGSPGGFALRGNVAHFSWWNIDVSANPAFLRIRGFAPAGYGIAPNVTAYIAAVSIGGGPSSIATTAFPADLRSLPMPVPSNRDIAVGLCTYVQRSPPGPGDLPLLACGSATANAPPGAVQNVDVPLVLDESGITIVAQPQDRTVLETRTASFQVAATSGDGSSLSYQWRRNGADIGGATNASYTTPATVLADDGAQFSVLVSNDSGSELSNPATLHVTAAPIPTIVTGPTCTREPNATFGVTIASGTSADEVQVRLRLQGSQAVVATGTDPTAPYEVAVAINALADGDYNAEPRSIVGNDIVTGATRALRIDRALPTVTARSPAQGAQADAGTPITFTLDGPVDPASIVDANVILRLNGTVIAKTLSLGVDERTVTITPVVPGQAGQYQVELAAIADCAGNLLLPETWTFELLSFVQLGNVVNFGDAGTGRSPSLAYDFQGAPWVAYTQDNTGTATDRVLVRRFENGDWQNRGGQLNTTPATTSGFILNRIAIDGLDRPVVAFLQVETAVDKLRVRRLEGSSWVELGTAPLNVTAGSAQNPMIAMGDQNRPIVAWIENGRIRAKRYDEGSATWLVLGPAEVAFASQVGLASFGGVPYLSWGEFTSASGNALNYTVRAARYDEGSNAWVSLISDFRSATTVNNTSIAVGAVDSPYVAHSVVPFVVSGAPQPQDIRLVRRIGGQYEEVLPLLRVDPTGRANVSDTEMLGASPAVAFNESTFNAVTGAPTGSRIFVRVGLPGGFTIEPATITGATELGNPDIAANPSTNLANGRLGIVFPRAQGRIAFKKRD